MSKLRTTSILSLVLLIPVGFLMFPKPAKVPGPTSPWQSTMRLSDPEMDVSKLSVYETLPDYAYAGPTLRLIFLDAEGKPIRKFKGNLTLLDEDKGGSPGSFSSYDFDSCRFALVESDANNRAILAGGTYSLVIFANDRSHIVPYKIEMPGISPGVKEVTKVIHVAELLASEAEFQQRLKGAQQ